jgi:hypothetical protein
MGTAATLVLGQLGGAEATLAAAATGEHAPFVSRYASVTLALAGGGELAR